MSLSTCIILGKSYMEIEQTKALTGLSMFGNAGGYLGMFLGWALMQLPDFVHALYEWYRKWNVGIHSRVPLLPFYLQHTTTIMFSIESTATYEILIPITSAFQVVVIRVLIRSYRVPWCWLISVDMLSLPLSRTTKSKLKCY